MNNVEKWKHTGLLAELEESKLESCANLLENIANILLEKCNANAPEPNIGNYTNKAYSRKEFVAGMLIPIGRVVYNENLKTIPTAEWLYENFVSYLQSKPMLVQLEEPIVVESFVKHIKEIL
jgi:hypothetical protein